MAKKKPTPKRSLKDSSNDLTERDSYPDEEQGIVPERTPEQLLNDIRSGGHETDPLTAEGRESLVEDDEIEPWEAGFSEGASEEGQLGKDALTGEPLMDEDEVVEAEINGKLYRFVNEKNAQKFRLRHKEDLSRLE